MFGNKTLIGALALTALLGYSDTLLECRPYQRLGLGPDDWSRVTRRNKGERKRMKGARWALPARTPTRSEERKRDRAHKGSD